MVIGRHKRHRLLRDLANAMGDVATIAARHRMSRDALAAWMDEPDVRRAIVRMCKASDVQAEMALSQFRLHAATRLLRLATAEVAQKGDETIRRACRDVLTLQPPAVRDEQFDPNEVSEAEVAAVMAEMEAEVRRAEAAARRCDAAPVACEG